MENGMNIELRWVTSREYKLSHKYLQYRTRPFCVDASGAFCDLGKWSEWKMIPTQVFDKDKDFNGGGK